MLRLFIEDKEVELNGSVQVAITKQFEDLSNPTAIINDWSKTVSIPFTQNNHKLFGHIYNPSRTVTYTSPTSLLGSPSNIKKWDGTNYVNDSLVSGNIVCDLATQYVQLGFQKSDWKYTSTKNYNCNNDSHTYEFIYNAENDYRLEFSFRDLSSTAPNNEVYFVQWELFNIGLVEGETYVVSFKHKKSGNDYIIYDWSLAKRQSYTGLNFDPYKKLDFRLQWGDDVLMTGYAKLNDIKQTGGKGTYNITLFGQLGKIFQEMKKITFDTTTNDTQYLIHGEDYVDEYISKDLVYKSWTSTGQEHSELYPKYLIPSPGASPVSHPAYKVTDIIGFAPNNARSEGFDYQSYQNDNNINKFTDTLGDSFTQATGVNPDAVIPEGMMPREIGEYRSYLQLPYIYFNKLFQIFKKKSEELTGYTFNLSDNWFNDANPYWKNLVMMLKTFKVDKDDGTKHNLYTMRAGDLYWSGSSSSMSEVKTQSLLAYSKQEQEPIIEAIQVTPAIFHIPNKASINIDFEVPMYIQSPTVIKNSKILPAKLANGMLYLRIGIYNQNDEEIDYRVYKVRSSTDDPDDSYGWDYNTKIVFEAGDPTETTGYYYFWKFNVKDTFTVTEFSPITGTENTSFHFKYEAKWSDRYGSPLVGNPVLLLTDSSYSTKAIYVRQDWDATVNMNLSTELKRSYSHFTLNDLWNKDFNLFDVIINYCKTYRILISVDELNKQINFTPQQVLFNNYKVVDWTNKVDKSKDFIVKPVSFDKKYVLFNYADNKTYLGEEYKKKYGVNYGDYKVVTDYNFNNEKEELFTKTAVGSITNTNNVLSWTNIYDNHKIMYSFPAEIYIYNKDKDGKQVDLFGSYYFHNGLASFSTESELALRTVHLSDDGATQVRNNTYCYSQHTNDAVSMSREVYSYPYLDIVRGSNLCTFNIPSENYTYLQNYANKKSIYKNFWNSYINERYNIQNKIITCYIDLKPTDYGNFNWNTFVIIDNVLCIVNKIYDYDVTSNGTTKVDLVTVQDIKGYNDDTFLVDIDDLILHFLGTSYLSGIIMSNPTQLGTFETATDVTFANGTKTYTTNGVRFTISGNTVYYQSIAKYVDKEDADFYVTLKNEHNTGSFHCVRYATYPYPEIKLYESDGVTERSTIYPGSRNYKLAWYGTETYGLENKPTVTIEIHGTGSATINANTWEENQVMIAEGDDEWFREEYVVDFNTNMTNYNGSYVRITIVDKEGWHETRDYPVSI